MNAFVLRIVYGNSRMTLQIFLSTNKAMCFTSNFSKTNFYNAFNLLATKYGSTVTDCTLCTTVWTYRLLSRIIDMNKFYSHCLLSEPKLLYTFEPEIFPCITIRNFEKTSVVVRLFYSGKLMILGVHHVKEMVEPLSILCNMFFDYSLSCNLSNF